MQNKGAHFKKRLYKEAIEIGKCPENYKSSVEGTFLTKHGCHLYTGQKEDGIPEIVTNENFWFRKERENAKSVKNNGQTKTMAMINDQLLLK